jgi:hypothetical protein
VTRPRLEAQMLAWLRRSSRGKLLRRQVPRSAYAAAVRIIASNTVHVRLPASESKQYQAAPAEPSGNVPWVEADHFNCRIQISPSVMRRE